MQANLKSMVCQKGEPAQNVFDLPAHSNTKEAHANDKLSRYSSMGQGLAKPKCDHLQLNC